MEYGAEQWAEVGRRIRSRMNFLGWNQGDLCKATGFSRETVRPFMAGTPNTRKEGTGAKIARALGWTGDSIAAILDGGEPAVAADTTPEISRGHEILNSLLDLPPDALARLVERLQEVADERLDDPGAIDAEIARSRSVRLALEKAEDAREDEGHSGASTQGGGPAN